ncbi:MAG: hypothetical protein R3Y05_05495 [bacterium]
MKDVDYKCINPNDATFYTVTINYLSKTITEDFEWLDTESIKLLKLIKNVISELEFEKGRSMLEYFEDYNNKILIILKLLFNLIASKKVILLKI